MSIYHNSHAVSLDNTQYLSQERKSTWRQPGGLVWEMKDSSGWKRIEGDFGKF
jgi:hypothetical protein